MDGYNEAEVIFPNNALAVIFPRSRVNSLMQGIAGRRSFAQSVLFSAVYSLLSTTISLEYVPHGAYSPL